MNDVNRALLELVETAAILCREDGIIVGANEGARRLVFGGAPPGETSFRELIGADIPGEGRPLHISGDTNERIVLRRSPVPVPGHVVVILETESAPAPMTLFAEHRTPIIGIDAETGALRLANESAALFYGYPLTELLRLDISDIDTRAKRSIMRALRNTVEKSDGLLSSTHAVAGGLIRDVQLHVGRIVFQGAPAYVCIVFDVSVLMGLGGPKGTEDLFRLMVETAPTGAYLQHRTASYVNPALARILGHSREDLLSMGADEVIHPQDFDRVRAMGEQGDGHKNVRYEVRVLRPDGATRWIEVAVNNIGYKEDVASIGTVVDITERKLLEENLRSSREMFRVMTESALMGVVMFRETFIYANEEACRISGYDRDEIMRMGALDWVHPDDLEFIRSTIFKRANDRQSSRIEFRIIKKDGTDLRIRSHATTVDIDGVPTSIANFMEVSQEYEAPEQITGRDMQFREIFYRHDAIMMLVDPEAMTILDANEAACGFYGYPRPDLIGNHVSMICPEMVDETPPGRFFLNKGRVQARNVLRNGATATVEVYSTLIRIGGRTTIFAIIHDISQRISLQKMLEESESMFRMISEQVMAPVFISGKEILFVNNMMGVLTGHEPGDLIGRSSAIWGEIVPEAKEAFKKNLNSRLTGENMGTITYPMFRLKTKTGETRWVNITTMGAVYHGQNVTIGTVVDVTDMHMVQKDLEEQVRMESKQRQVSEGLLAHQSRLAVMGEMLGAITHQWRQPLNTIGLIAQDIEDAVQFDELDRGYVKDSVASIMEQITFMSETVEDFRDFFRPTTTIRAFDVETAVNDALKMLSAQLRTKNVRVDFHAEGASVVSGSLNEFKHVIINLLNNAQDAIIGRMESDPDATDGIIRISIVGEGDSVQLVVEDNGEGIPESVFHRIFEPYFTTKPEDHGTGIGLYLSRAIIEDNMGGTIAVENTSKGARFVITLPQASMK